MKQSDMVREHMKVDKVRVIGITGGIGSGKSTVMNMLRDRYNAEIIVADELGHMAMEYGSDTYYRMTEEFGEEILDKDRRIDRKKLSDLLLSSEEKLMVQNSIVHPFVTDIIKERIAAGQNAKVSLIAVESAILFESGCDSLCDEVWFVTADSDVRIQRLVSYRGYSRSKAEAFIAKQKPDDFFIRNCSKVIYNNGNIENLSKQLEKCMED